MYTFVVIISCAVIFTVILLLILLKVILKSTWRRNDSNVCLVGRTAIVTGGNAGIGYETARKLAVRGCKVIIADISNGIESVEKIKAETTNPNVFWKFIDLASFASVRKFAEEFVQEEGHLDILVNNAGCAGFEGVYTEDGVLKWLQVNCLGAFLLTHLLVDLLKKSKDGRIVFLASISLHIFWFMSVPSLNKEPTFFIKGSHTLLNYAKSKMCNLMMARVFAQRLQNYKITCSAVTPGIVNTVIYKNSQKNITKRSCIANATFSVFNIWVQFYGKTPEQGAETSLHSIMSPKIQSGEFYMDCMVTWAPSISRNKELMNDFWEECEKLTKLQDNEKLNCEVENGSSCTVIK